VDVTQPASHGGGPGSIQDHVGFVVDKVALGHVSLSILIPQTILSLIYHPGLVQEGK
jgi:hypothetical protein